MVRWEFFCFIKVRKFWTPEYKNFVLYQIIHTLRKIAYSKKKIILYQNIRTRQKNSYTRWTTSKFPWFTQRFLFTCTKFFGKCIILPCVVILHSGRWFQIISWLPLLQKYAGITMEKFRISYGRIIFWLTFAFIYIN